MCNFLKLSVFLLSMTGVLALVVELIHSSRKKAYTAICCCECVRLWLMNELSTSAQLGTCYKAHELTHQTLLLGAQPSEENTPTVGIHEMCVFCPNDSVQENPRIKGERKFYPLTEIPTSTNSNTAHSRIFTPNPTF